MKKFTRNIIISLLSKILLVSKGKVLETIYYKYSDGNLQGIYHFINNSLILYDKASLVKGPVAIIHGPVGISQISS